MARLTAEARRAQLIELGIALFSDRAYEEVGIEDIAEAAGVSRGLMHHHFGSKRGFYLACLDLEAERLVDATEVDTELPPLERVHAGLTAWLSFVRRRERAFLALMGGGVGTDHEVAALLDRTRDALARRVTDSLGPDGEAADVTWAVRAWLGATERTTLDQLTRPTLDDDHLVDLLGSLLVVALSLTSAGANLVTMAQRA